MSASQQAQNKHLHELIDQLEEQLDRANCENEQLKALLQEAFGYGRTSEKTFDQWAKSKGLT